MSISEKGKTPPPKGEEDDEDPPAEQEVTTEEEAEAGAEDFPDDQDQDFKDPDDGNDGYPPDDDQAEPGQDEDMPMEFIKPPKNDSFDGGDDDDYYDELDNADDEDDDDDDDLMAKPSQSMVSVHISRVEVSTPSEAALMAEEVLKVLEEDVATYVATNGIVLDAGDEEETVSEELPRKKISGSSVSISSDISITLPGDPSKVRMFYEKFESQFKDDPIPHIQGEGMDEACEAQLHRSGRKKDRSGFTDTEQQTKEMTFVPETKAQMIFMDMYPRPEDWVEPAIPSRQKSMAEVMLLAEKEDPSVDRSRLDPQIISISNRKKLLQPLRDDYYKDETFWTGSRFRGEYRNRQFLKGNYDHPTGVKYQSEWKDGHFHTQNHYGVMVYPRGDIFEGQWYEGRYQSGEITFGDGLKYNSGTWQYCEPPDRRMRVERVLGLKPAGNTIYNDQYPMRKLPPGFYDVGDGIYNPKTGEVLGFDGFLLRKVTVKEHEWIKQYCRKAPTPEDEFIPTFQPDRIPGCSMEQLQRFNVAKRRTH